VWNIRSCIWFFIFIKNAALTQSSYDVSIMRQEKSSWKTVCWKWSYAQKLKKMCFAVRCERSPAYSAAIFKDWKFESKAIRYNCNCCSTPQQLKCILLEVVTKCGKIMHGSLNRSVVLKKPKSSILLDSTFHLSKLRTNDISASSQNKKLHLYAIRSQLRTR